jgi:hypothetical protein
MATIYYPDGTLVRGNGNEVYMIVGGERRLVSDFGLEANDEGTRSVSVDDFPTDLPALTPEMLEALPVGEPIIQLEGVVETERQDEVRSSMPRRYMWTRAVLSQEAGRLDCTTRTWTRQPWVGFTAGAMIMLADSNGEYLWSSGLVQFGVDGFRIPFKSSDRTDRWQQSVPQEVSRKATRIEIVHTHAPKNRLNDIIRETAQVSKDIAGIVQAIMVVAA